MPHLAVHPGKVLAQELESLGVTPTELARQLEVPPNRISQIINGKRAITGDTAVRLAHWFGTHPEFWLNLQTAYEVRQAERHLGASVRRLPTKAHRLARSTSPRPKAAT
jgi:antitoxin HigA-1